MASTIITKNKNTGAPSTLAAGELAINTEIGSLYYGSTGGTAVSSSFTFSNITSSGTISASGMIQTAGAISSSTGITASDAFFSGHITASNLSLAGNIHHTGDTNTKISFGADRLIAIAGGTTGIEMGSLGITTLTAGNALNIGAHTFTAKQLVANVTTGTAPMQITSTTLVSNLNADKLDGADLIDEDDMSSDSATAVPTQQSVKAYVDTNAGFSGNKFATDLKVGRDADNLIDFTTDNQVTFRVSAGDGIIMKASGEIEATKFDGDLEGNADTATTATNATHVTVTDNESTNEENLIPFIEDASATGNVGLESDGDFAYNPSTGTVSATIFKGTTSLQTPLIEFTDGDDAITIADGGVVTIPTLYSNNHEILTAQSFKIVDLDNGYYGMPGNSGYSSTTWGFQKTDGADGLGNGGQHVGVVMPYKAILVGVIGQFRASATGNYQFALWTEKVEDGEAATATDWTETIITSAVNNNNATRTFNFEKLDGTTAFVKGTSVVPSFYNDSGTDNSDIFGNYTIVIQRVI